MAGGLVREEIDLDAVGHDVFQQIHNIPVIGDGHRLFVLDRLEGQPRDLFQVGGDFPDPALPGAGLDPGGIHFCDNGHRPADFSGLGLGPAHPSEAGGDEKPAFQVLMRFQSQFQTAGIEQGVVGSVHDPLGADVHPAARCHLPVAGHSHLGSGLPVLLIVILSDEQPIGDDHPWTVRTGTKQSQGMAGLHHQGLVLGQDLEISLDQTILHPVLADPAGFPVGHQFIGIQGHIEIQVVVDHDLEGLPGQAVACILLQGFGPDRSRGAKAVAVDPAPGSEFLEQFRGHGLVQGCGDIAQRVAERRLDSGPAQAQAPIGGPPDAGLEVRHSRQGLIQLDAHGVVDIDCHQFPLIQYSDFVLCIELSPAHQRFSPLHPGAQEHFGHHCALQTEGQIAGIAQHRHFKDMKGLHKGDGVFPLGQTVHIPHLPEKSADQGRAG